MNHVVRLMATASALSLAAAAFAQKSGTNEVRVVNPPTLPVPVKNVEAPARVKYQKVVSFQRNDAATCPSSGACNVLIDTVPAGKRLVIEHVSLAVNAYVAPTFVAFGHTSLPYVDNVFIVKPDFVLHQFGPSNSEPFYVMDRPVLVYYEAAEQVRVKVLISTSGLGALSSNVTLHGQLVDVLP